MQNTTHQRIEAQLEAQRFAAQQAGREMPEAALVENAWQRWSELFMSGLYREANRFFAAHKDLMIGAA